MEQNPNAKQPEDYTKYSGKMDHTSCICISVTTSDFRQTEQKLDNLVIRMRHPVDGLSAADPQPDSNKDQQRKSFKKTFLQRGKEITTSKFVFKGSQLIDWLNSRIENHYLEDVGDINEIAQTLLGFRYITPIGTEAGSFVSETFMPEMAYTFQVYEPIMSLTDWELIMQIGLQLTYMKDEVIIEEGETHQRIFQINQGTCRIEKRSAQYDKDNTKRDKNKLKPKRASKKLKDIKVLGTMSDVETFGEITFLEGGSASASVIADEDNVEVFLVEGNILNILFVRYPDLEGRFYHYLASILARRLKKREKDNYQPLANTK